MRLLRKLLFPISLVYGLIVFVRNLLFDIGVISSKKFEVPTICVGNLSVGGTGKTPMTEFLITLLKPYGKLAVLSRGYRRKSTGFKLADERTTVEDLGDEPFQIYQKFKDVAVAVNADRRGGIREIMKRVTPDLIVLDDAYQHRKVRPSFSILLTSYGNLYVDDWYLPTGNLRDSKRAAARAQIIVVTKCPPNLDTLEQERIVSKLKPRSHQKVLFSYLDYGSKAQGQVDSIIMEELKGVEFTLVTGIANPTPLVDHLKNEGFTFEHLAFRDHHFFSLKEIENLAQRGIIITTEKDFVKLGQQLSKSYYLPIRHVFFGNGIEVLKKVLVPLMKGRS